MKKYDSYKDSGFDWVGEVPSSWSITRLKFVGEIMPSGIDKKSKEGEQAVLLCNYVDVYKNDYITKNIDFMKATASDAQISRLSLIEGDVIATKDSEDPGDIGVPALVKETLKGIVCGYHLTMLRANKRKLIGDYLYWCVLSNGNSQYFETEARGVTRYAIGTHVFNNLRTPLPPLKEQTQIANYLDHKTAQIDTLINNSEKLIALLKEERTAVINQAVTKGLDPNVPMKDSGIEWLGEIPEHWEVKKLKYFSQVVLGKMLTSSDKGGYFLKPYLRAKNIEWLEPNVNDIKKMWFSEKEMLNFRVKENDLLVSEGGEVGRTCVWKNQTDEIYIQNSVHKVTILNGGNSEYFLNLFYLFGHYGHFDAIVNRISIAHLTKEKLMNISFIYPPINEQNKISNYIQKKLFKIDSIIDKTEQEIELLKEYKTALISEVVTGKVKVV